MEKWLRKTPLQNISFIAIMAAINGAFSILLSFVPYSAIFALLILPVINALGVYFVDRKWVLVYLVTNIAVPMLATMYDFSSTMFYVIPSIISGIIYGCCSKAGLTPAITILVSSVWSVCATYASLPLIKMIYGIDMIEACLTTFGVSQSGITSSFEYALLPSIVFALSWAATSISHFITIFIYERVNIRFNSREWECITYPAASIILSLSAIGIAFINTSIAYILLSLALYFTTFSLQNLIKSHDKWLIALMISLFVVSLFGFAGLYQKMPQYTGSILIVLFFIILSISSLIAYLKAKKLAK